MAISMVRKNEEPEVRKYMASCTVANGLLVGKCPGGAGLEVFPQSVLEKEQEGVPMKQA